MLNPRQHIAASMRQMHLEQIKTNHIPHKRLYKIDKIQDIPKMSKMHSQAQTTHNVLWLVL